MVSALLFDLDGTLANTDTLHERAWREMVAPLGIPLDTARYREVVSGRTNAEIVASLLPRMAGDEARELILRKEARFRSLSSAVEPVAGLRALLETARRAGCPMALVTNAPRDNADHMLRGLGLLDTFAVRVQAEDVPVGKPDPAPYQLALARLGIPPAQAIAFEDSRSGVLAAVAAELRVVGLTTTHDRGTLLAAGADPVVTDFTDPDLLALLGLPIPAEVVEA